MDSRDGRIYSDDDLKMMKDYWAEGGKRFLHPVKPTPLQRIRRKVGRNEACPCGSQKKFKKCCLFKPA